jgi:hypothetical protein
MRGKGKRERERERKKKRGRSEKKTHCVILFKNCLSPSVPLHKMYTYFE